MSARIDDVTRKRAERAIREAGLDGWLLYDLEGRNPIACQILGLPEGTSRRSFVLIRPGREPVALGHAVERQNWSGWNGELREYVGWEELERELGTLLKGHDWIAMEISERDAVPFVDLVPVGVVELVEECGVRVVSSEDLVTRSCARWSERGMETHRRASGVLAGVARETWERAHDAAASGRSLDEHTLAEGIFRRCSEEGLEEVDAIVAVGPNSALPHYYPPEEGSRRVAAGEVLLVDLWGRVAGEPESVFADQTWMGILGPEPPEGFPEAWAAVRDARDGVVELLRERTAAGAAVTGAEADARAREVIEERGFGDALLHRTGHGIDRALHGFGPNLDCVETRDERELMPGVGFSVEPGVYFEGEWGIRSEINVHMGPDGPEVTTPDPQDEPWTAAG